MEKKGILKIFFSQKCLVELQTLKLYHHAGSIANDNTGSNYLFQHSGQ
jgi:hypothetical protein